jgi:DNA polymerase IIIc chi subunit
MMILKDNTHELMINPQTGERFLRPLSAEEIFDVIDSKYSDDEAEEKFRQLTKAGLSIQDIIFLALKKE